MQLRKTKRSFPQTLLLIVIAVSLISGSLVSSVRASPGSSYSYGFSVNREGFTNVTIIFQSTDALGQSWVFVPKFQSWNYTYTGGNIVNPQTVETDKVGREKQYFYQAFKFGFTTSGTFKLTIEYGFDNGALIIEPRGIFYSPLIAFQSTPTIGTGQVTGIALVSFDSSFTVNPALAVVYSAMGNQSGTVQGNTVVFSSLPGGEARIQIEFNIDSTSPQYTTLTSNDNRTFTFKSVTRYQSYAKSVLQFYDHIYSNFTSLFNVTVSNVVVQWFLPDFESLFIVGGYVPIETGQSAGQLGNININVAFTRTVNGTIEVIAAHELVHRFLGKTGISPSDFLWFHEGMAQYVSVSLVSDLGYEGAIQYGQDLENASSTLIQELSGEDFSKLQLQYWTPTYEPQGVSTSALYAAAYYVASRLPQAVELQGFDYYSRFFKQIQGVKINNIDVLSLYLSTAVNASVVPTLQHWGFQVADLFESPARALLVDAAKVIANVNPVFQPWKSFAEYFYQQAVLSAQNGDWARAESMLNLAISMANLAPFLTFLTIIVILGLLYLALSRRSRRPKPTEPTVPPLPPEILQPTA